ncbi:MAG: nucleotide exchange factor GrpE [Methanomassiliicoccales archaeon]|nr:nucleotide exchange factor GrpE [Methanomassiliicoccales archaeon]
MNDTARNNVNTGTAAETEPTDEVSKLKQEVAEIRKELDSQVSLAKEYLDAAKRIQAEFDNHKKRAQREREEFAKASSERLIYELLPILDDLERALGVSCGFGDLKVGIGQVHGNLVSLLRGYGLKEISSDGKFDPQYHEALSTGNGDDDDILEVYQKGYFLGSRVLRHSKVKVAKKSDEGENNVENNRN